MLFLVPCLVVLGGEKSRTVTGLTLENGVRFSIVEKDDWFVGLSGFAIEDASLSVDSSLAYPLLAGEWDTLPWVGAGLQLREVKAAGDGWDLHFIVYGSEKREAWADWFVLDEEGEVVRDKYRFARTHPLGLLTRLEERVDRLPSTSGDWLARGNLVWKIRPHTEIIAGWPWAGWSWSVEVDLEEPFTTTAIRILSSWETGGELAGLTLANQRYRGLGHLEQAVEVDAAGASLVNFTTADIPLPGELGRRSSSISRDKALELRNESWIHAPARGAGTGYFDFQYTSQAALVSYPERQGNHRALVEFYRGDTGVAQIHEEFFGSGGRHQGGTMHFAVLRQDTSRAPHFWRTRYLEVDRELRARVAEELGFLSDRAVPTVGYLFDFWGRTDRFAPVISRMANYAGYLASLGVQRVMVHNPGWINGRAVERGWDGGERFANVGGSVNNIYDWYPLPDVEGAWREVSLAMDALGLEYYVWITGMVQDGARFAKKAGRDPANWALNSPGGPPNASYGEDMLKFNIHSDAFRSTFTERLQTVRESFGYQGFWGDSFQNLWMSQLGWAGNAGRPMQRAWWEWLAERSNEGVGWISESHSFPGLSCSIETAYWETTPWMLGFTTKWLRGNAQTERSARQWGQIAFQLMAYQAWLAPEIWPYHVQEEVDPETVIEDFSRLAWEYRAALPVMERPYILPGMAGALWLSHDYPGEAVLFAFADQRTPDEIQAWPILDASGQRTGRLREGFTYRLQGTDFLNAFGLAVPPLEDRRTPLQLRPDGSNLEPHPETWLWAQPPHGRANANWEAGSTMWKGADGTRQTWPQEEPGPHVYFSPGTRTYLDVKGRVATKGIQAPEPGVGLIIDTEAGDLLRVDGPLTGQLDVYFKGTLRKGPDIHTPERFHAGLKLSGGNHYTVAANFLPWPESYNLHSQLVSLEGPGTTIYYTGQWPATGELSRPGLVLGEGTRFVIRPEAEFPFIKNYGGFTLQLWVTGVGGQGGTLEMHEAFEADKSRHGVSPFGPRGRGLRLGSLGSIRLSNATLVTHHSRSLPMTGRRMGDKADSIQNNGHLVFEGATSRWEVRTWPQAYAGAIWIDADTVIHTERDLTHRGVVEEADEIYHYTASNGFQTRHRKRPAQEGPIHIRKEGPAALILEGEQAYAPETRLLIEDGRVVMRSDPAMGGLFPDGKTLAGPTLEVTIRQGAALVLDTPSCGLASLSAEAGSILECGPLAGLQIAGEAVLDGDIRVPETLAHRTRILTAGRISGEPALASQAGRLIIEDADGRSILIFEPENE